MDELIQERIDKVKQSIMTDKPESGVQGVVQRSFNETVLEILEYIETGKGWI